MIETDPGLTDYVVATDYQEKQPPYEVGREIVMRLPIARHNISQLQNEAVQKEPSLDEESAAPTTPRQTVQSHPEIPN